MDTPLFLFVLNNFVVSIVALLSQLMLIFCFGLWRKSFFPSLHKWRGCHGCENVRAVYVHIKNHCICKETTFISYLFLTFWKKADEFSGNWIKSFSHTLLFELWTALCIGMSTLVYILTQLEFSSFSCYFCFGLCVYVHVYCNWIGILFFAGLWFRNNLWQINFSWTRRVHHL